MVVFAYVIHSSGGNEKRRVLEDIESRKRDIGGPEPSRLSDLSASGCYPGHLGPQ